MKLHEVLGYNWTQDRTYVGNIDVSHKQLTTLKGAPHNVVGEFDCGYNNLTSLEGAPKVITGDLFCKGNKIESLHNIHKIITEIRGTFDAQGNPIKSHVLGLLYIKGLKGIKLIHEAMRGLEKDKHPLLLIVQDILIKYLPNTKGHSAVLECQSELLDAGFDEYAQL